MKLIFKDFKSCLRSFDVPGLLLPKCNTPLWQRGERGDLLNKKSSLFVLKIPLIPPFPKGELFLLLEQNSL
jgi:hypothetical protein